MKRKGGDDHYVGRRYGDFVRLHKAIRLELPGRVLPSLPRKNKSDSRASNLFSGFGGGGDDDDADSVSSASTNRTSVSAMSQANGERSLSPSVQGMG